MVPAQGEAFDAAPFGGQLGDGPGVVWDDPREIHRVVVVLREPPAGEVRVEYWRGRWPGRRLPKDHVPGGGAVGWWELGDWYHGEWQAADAECRVEGSRATYTFRPLNRIESPDLADFPATFRTTHKLRLVGPGLEAGIQTLAAYTDSLWDERLVTVLLAEEDTAEPAFEAFNGHVAAVEQKGPGRLAVRLWATANPDPNSFDATLLTVRAGETVTVSLRDVACGPVWVRDLGLAVVEGEDTRDYAAVAAEAAIAAPRGVYDAVRELPEQTWRRAWEGMVPKRRRLYLPLAADGARHKFRVHPDGSVEYRTNNALLAACPGRDSARLAEDGARLVLSFGLPEEPADRTIEDGVLPVGIARWRGVAGEDGIEVQQVALATVLAGTDPDGPPPPADDLGVLMVRLAFRNTAAEARVARLPMTFTADGRPESVTAAPGGLLQGAGRTRAMVDTRGRGDLAPAGDGVEYRVELLPGEEHAVVVKVPYLAPAGEKLERLAALDFEVERAAVVGYWRRRLAAGMKLTVPEPVLSDFHAAHAAHLLINCEKEPDSERRFARVGSFGYAAYGNESCMMIVDLDRRGYHDEARQCLDAFLEYQGTAALPGDFSSQEGVLYGAHGYEDGGYNQHHGWILWCLVEHYRFTRDDDWLARWAPGIVKAADWIVGQCRRTVGRDDIGRGLLPHGSLEDIGDWWQWLSTNAYTWRGLDAAAWGLEQLAARDARWSADAQRLRREAGEYHGCLLRAFREAAERSPVVGLRDGTWVPHFPSHVHRRGRSFGWICETLEGAIHLLIAGVLDPRSREAGWILRDYEDNLYLSDQYGYSVPDFGRHWFDWGGFSMQACLLLGVEPYLARDDVPSALRAAFNAIAAQCFPDTRMLTEHALPELGDWGGDHYKTSDEANAAGWLRYLFVREEGEELLLGQAVPREWLRPGGRVGVERAATHFGPVSLIYEAEAGAIAARLSGPRRNPPARIRLRFRAPLGRVCRTVEVNGEQWGERCGSETVLLPGDIGDADVRVALA